MKRFFVFILISVLLWAMWFFLCPYSLVLLEGFDFFAALPDFTFLNLDIPGAPLKYISAFLLQFYAHPALAAVIHTLLPMLSVFCIWLIFKNVWIALLPLPLLLWYQTGDLSLVPYLTGVAVSALAAVVYHIFASFVRVSFPQPKILNSKWLGISMVSVSVLMSLFVIWNGYVRNGYEKIARLDYLVENRMWNEVIDSVSPQEAGYDDYRRKCVLLALSETGRLADDAFLYGLSGSSDFVFGNTENVMYRNFNMNFYSTSGLVNPTVYYAFQQATQFVLGMNFDSARCLADTYLKVGDYALAKKYLDILSHSSCHGKWVRDRLDKLESIRDAVPEYRVDEKHIWGNFVYDMSLMHERCPEDRRFADFLLCALLADRNKDLFYKYFQDVAAEHYQSSIPRLYQEILLLIAQEEPEAASRYEISEEVRDQYKNFVYLVSSGREKVARKRYSGTYWAYLYFQNHKHP